MRTLKFMASIWLVMCLSAAVSTWGGEWTKNPIIVSVGIFISIVVLAIISVYED